MGLFSAFKKGLRATVNTALLPVDIVADAITLGGVSTRDGKSFVVKRGKKICEDLGDAVDEVGED